MSLIFDNDLSVEVVRTKRKKTASIKVIDGLVQAVVPSQLSNTSIKQLVQKSIPWIRKKLREQSQAVTLKPKKFISGENFSYLGKSYRLKVLSGNHCKVKLLRGNLEMRLPRNAKECDIRNALADWYECHALERLIEKTHQYAGIVGVSPNSISVRNYKSRWGSCSSNGDICYNWRIIIAPHQIVDYVVVHELCHLRHLNHSPAYWESVRQVLPDYPVYRKWLREKGAVLEI